MHVSGLHLISLVNQTKKWILMKVNDTNCSYFTGHITLDVNWKYLPPIKELWKRTIFKSDVKSSIPELQEH